MEKVDLTKQFALRLVDAMSAAGFNSSRSTAGVDVYKLAEITGYSTVICRKYLKGDAIPEPTKLIDIAVALGISPGWLLFGEQALSNPHSQKTVTLSRNLLQYIFKRSISLYNANLPEEDVASFLLDLVNDVSQIDAEDAQLEKIIDLALSSVTHFSR